MVMDAIEDEPGAAIYRNTVDISQYDIFATGRLAGLTGS